MGVVVSTINAAVEARIVSSMKADRVAASEILPAPEKPKFEGDREAFIAAVHNALYASKIVSYAQGFDLMRHASDEFEWDLSLGEIAAILARRLYHSRQVFGSHYRGLRARFQAVEFDARSSFLPRFWPIVRTVGARRWRPVPSLAWRCPRRALRWPISILIARRVCRRICCRRSAIISARILTSASTATAAFTPNGSSRPQSRKANAILSSNPEQRPADAQ